MEPWFKECPERLEAELRALADGGFPTEVDSAARGSGELVLRVQVSVAGAVHEFRVVFPDDYPYFAFQVFAPSLSLARHQDPYSKQLCFRAHIETEWRSEDTVAEYLAERLPIILEASGADASFEGEGQEGAPVTGYLPFMPGSVVLLGDWDIGGHIKGTLLMGVEQGNNPHDVFRGGVLEVRADDKSSLANIDPRFRRIFERTFRARWVRLPCPPRTANPPGILSQAIEMWPALKQCDFNGDAPDVVGIVFKDEARYRELHDIWIFVVRRKDRKVATSRNRRLPPGDQLTCYLARADGIGSTDLHARVPRLVPLAKKKVAIFGLGALGSMATIQLARAGVGRLALVDHDFVSSGTMPRWALGLAAAGHLKPAILAGYLARSYPWIEVEPYALQVGNASYNALARECLPKIFDACDIIVDCTVEFTVHHYLSTRARSLGMPYVWASGTQGGWGGVVGRAVPNASAGCWGCYYRHRTDGTILSPSQEEGPDVQPVGCFSPTFRGAGFDMDQISVMASRLAVATLSRGVPDGYPDFTWDVGVVDLWKDGQPIAPEWKTYSLTRHHECDAHD